MKTSNIKHSVKMAHRCARARRKDPPQKYKNRRNRAKNTCIWSNHKNKKKTIKSQQGKNQGKEWKGALIIGGHRDEEGWLEQQMNSREPTGSGLDQPNQTMKMMKQAASTSKTSCVVDTDEVGVDAMSQTRMAQTKPTCDAATPRTETEATTVVDVAAAGLIAESAIHHTGECGAVDKDEG